jgi:hypothetical protein
MRKTSMLVFGFALALGGCQSKQPAQASATQGAGAPMTVSPEVWSRVASERVFFGHQSVGNNILVGIRELSAAPGGHPVRIVDTATGPVPDGPAVLHRYVGTNGEPLSKIRGFQQAMDSSLGQGVDVAAMKFCFWDIRAETDVRQVFAEYERTLAALEARHPTTRFVHLTVPLFAADTDWRAGIRRLIGRPVPRTLDNAKRQALSDLIRARYSGREPVFDLARLEAAAQTENGVPAMAPELTTDGGHLNPEGRRKLASAFLQAIATAPATPATPAGPAGTR